MLCQSVRRVPLPSGSSCQRRSASPQVYWSSFGGSARFTTVSETCGVGAPTVESLAVPVLPRLLSTSKGAHSRRCSGSVSACQTFVGGWRSSRTSTSVQLSPSFWTSAPAAAPGWYLSRLLTSSSSFGAVEGSCDRDDARAHRGVATNNGGTARARHRFPSEAPA